jgi:hypothetical protein
MVSGGIAMMLTVQGQRLGLSVAHGIRCATSVLQKVPVGLTHLLFNVQVVIIPEIMPRCTCGKQEDIALIGLGTRGIMAVIG